MPVLQHLAPFAFVLEHELAEEANGRHAMIEQFIMELLQRKSVAFLRFVIVAQLQNLQFAECIIEIAGIESAAHRLGPCRFLFIKTIFLKKFCPFIDCHVLRVHFDCHAQAA